MKAKVSLYLSVVFFIAVLGLAVGCNKAPNDSQIKSQVQERLNADSGLQGKSLNVDASNGVVTLSGAVDNDNERAAASRYASSVPGVKEVVNNLQVAVAAATATDQTAQNQPPAEEEKHKPVSKPRASRPRTRSLPSSASNAAPVASTESAASNAPYSPFLRGQRWQCVWWIRLTRKLPSLGRVSALLWTRLWQSKEMWRFLPGMTSKVTLWM